MADDTLAQKMDELISLSKMQIELLNRIHQDSTARRAYEYKEAQTERVRQTTEDGDDEDDTMMGNPFATPTPAARPQRSVSFAPGERAYTDREKYSTPTGARHSKPRLAPNKEDESGYINYKDLLPAQQKTLSYAFPKFNPRDVEIFIIEAEAWFRFNRVCDHETMVNHTGAHLEGSARDWWIAKIRIDRARQGKLFHDWPFFTQRLIEQYNPRNTRMEAYNKLINLKLTSDTPGAATRHVERFRDLEGQVSLEDTELVIDMFRGSLTRSLQEKFERNPPTDRWGWYREVEDIDRQRMLMQQSAARHTGTPALRPPQMPRPTAPTTPTPRPLAPPAPGAPYRPGNRPLPPHLAQRLKPTGPTTFGSNVCHLCKGAGHWAKDCPNRKAQPATPRPMGPRVAVALEDAQDDEPPAEDDGDARYADDGEDHGYDTVDQEPLDLTQFENPAAAATYANPQDDEAGDEGNAYGAMH